MVGLTNPLQNLGYTTPTKALDQSERTAGMSGNDARKGAPPAVIIDISEEAKVQSVRDTNIGAIDELLLNSKTGVTQALFGDVEPYRENLAVLLDDPNISGEERTRVANALHEREMKAFFHINPHHDGAAHSKAYIQYLDTLSPEELNSDRYRGKRALAVISYERAVARENGQAEDLEPVQNPVLALFEAVEIAGRDVEALRGARAGFEARLASFDDPNSDPFVRELSETVRNRFDALITMIDSAEGGNEQAFANLAGLLSGTLSGSDFAKAATTH